MRLDRILCLANSYKHSNRCVAGISVVTKKWVRLVGRTVPGCLTRNEAKYEDGKDALLLDVFEAQLDETCGSNCHPEDVFVAQVPWRHVGRLDEFCELDFPAAYVNYGPMVLQGYCDRVLTHTFEKTPALHSLSLIEPDDLFWWIREENGKRKHRAVFHLGRVGRVHYNLPVTDPAWLDQLNLLPTGIHPNALLCGYKSLRTFLTISLSEPFEGFHYKLVAGVVNLRPEPAAPVAAVAPGR